MADEGLQSTGAAQTEAAPAAAPAEAAPAQAQPDSLGAAAQQAQAEQAAAQTQAADAASGVVDTLGQAADAEAQTEQQAEQAAPESYAAFKLDGQDVPSETVESFSAVAKELGLSQENAQKVFDSIAPVAQKYSVQKVASYAKDWAAALPADPEFGGEHYKENCAIAGKAYQKLATPGLRTLLGQTGLSNHPEVMRLFYRLGKDMVQDRGVAGGASAPARKTFKRFPNSNMVEDL